MTRSHLYRRYVIFLLLLIYIFNQLDRNIFDILMEPIKQDLLLSDSQLGFVAGPALIIFYTLLGVPVARLADRVNRVHLMALAIVIWGVVTMLTAAADTFLHLTFARVGVGIGEAGFSAVAIAFLSDLVGPRERTRAISIFMMAFPLSLVLSNLVGGWVNQTHGWRVVYVLAGAPGIVLALLLILTVREPRDDRSAIERLAEVDRPTLKMVLSTLWNDRPLRHLWIGQGVANLVSNSTAWMAPYLMRAYGMKTGELGTWLAVIGFSGIASIGLSGYLSSRRRFASMRAQARLLLLASIITAPALWLALWMPAATPALLMLLVAQIPLHFFSVPSQSISQGLAPSQMRATIAALFILLQHLTAGFIGIQGVGMLSDIIAPHVGGPAEGLRWAMAIAVPLTFWAAYHFWRAGQMMTDDVPDYPHKAPEDSPARPGGPSNPARP